MWPLHLCCLISGQLMIQGALCPEGLKFPSLYQRDSSASSQQHCPLSQSLEVGPHTVDTRSSGISLAGVQPAHVCILGPQEMLDLCRPLWTSCSLAFPLWEGGVSRMQDLEFWPGWNLTFVSLNHWTTRDVLLQFLVSLIVCSDCLGQGRS